MTHTMGSFTNLNNNDEINNNLESNRVILAIDIGTTNLKCSLFNTNLDILHSVTSKLQVLQPFEGHSEIEADYLLALVKSDLKKCIKTIPSSYVVQSLGISTQRNSVVLWNKSTGKNYSKIILWNDKQNSNIAESMNSGMVLNMLTGASYLASLAGTNISGHRLKMFSRFKVDTNHIAPTLKSQLTMLRNSLTASEFSKVLYGTIETWLMWNITKEQVHATDVSCAGCTGVYDTFQKKWSYPMSMVLGIPMRLYPKVYDTCHQFGHLKPEILGLDYEVPITAIVGDAQASVIAESASEIGDCVITIGTGAFISANIGDTPLSSDYGFYPMPLYKHKEDSVYILHGGISSAGVAIEWAQSIGLFTDYKEMDEILQSTENSNGVRFIAAFGYLEMEGIDKTRVGTGFIGIKRDTTKAHMLRAVVDSIAFAIKTRFDLMVKDLETNKIVLKSVRLSGGVAQCDFLCQYLANILELSVERSEACTKSSLYGAAFLAGIGGGKIWNRWEDLIKYRKNVVTFKPDRDSVNRNDCLVEWTQALQVYADWH